MPQVSVAENGSAFVVEATREHGPAPIVGNLKAPPGVTMKLKRRMPPDPQLPRAFVPPSGELEIASLAEAGEYGLATSLEKWEKVLVTQNPAPLMERPRLGELPWTNAARCFLARVRFHTFPWGKAVLFLTTYAQESVRGPVNNSTLTLTVQGVTHDRKYAVKGHFEIRHPALPDTLWQRGEVYFDIVRAGPQVEAWLDRQPDEAFQPTVADYIRFLEAVKITRP